ncbi:HAMP domain-containing histidine kinase [Jiella endophytica]|uniref:HAMP domain-containing histidine kinase n=1 Tax=Jiella endophytica TaxID=2558362 RepID=A0A4Y8RAZ3_9HYPH|nr:HAMP domain-containing histidine kinase [Jiella endophytica]TFF18037.1 HAMP domain-containing histidine kinase [Jiella endophytica]
MSLTQEIAGPRGLAPDSADPILTTAMVKAFCHDCRTPLAVISEFASIVREELEPNETGDSAELLGLVHDRVWDVETLLGTLEFLKVELDDPAGRPPAEIDVAALIEDLRPNIETIAARWGIEVQFLGPPEPPVCLCDAGSFREAVVALLNDLCRSASRRDTIRIGVPLDLDTLKLQLCLWRGEGWTPSELLGGTELMRVEPKTFRQRFAGIVLARAGGSLVIKQKDTGAAFVLQLSRP